MKRLAWLVLAALALLPGACLAAYPEKPITVIVAYSPGGGTDLVARAIAPFLVLSALRGMAAPKGMPADIREHLVKAVAAAAADPEFQAQATKFFAPLRFLTPAQFEAENREAEAVFRQLWKELPWAEK